MDKMDWELGLQTRAIHAGEGIDEATKAHSPALHMSTTYVGKEIGGFSALDRADPNDFCYTRWGNPTVQMLEQKLASLEGYEDCICLASGMAAAASMFMSLLSAGDHVVVSDVTYAGVAELVRHTLPRMGVEVTLVNMSDLEAVRAALRPETKLVHTESPANPIGRLTDLKAVCTLAHASGALVSCDATFASPLGQDSKALGLDIVMHSVTKYIGGHGDAVGGALLGSKAIIEKIRVEGGIHYGGIMSPFNAWLIARGASTLPLRMKAHHSNAMQVAEWLEGLPSVSRVIYPGLPSHPQYDLASAQMKNTSGMIAFQVGDVTKGEAMAQEMIERLKVACYAVSLGHHRSLIYWMGTDVLMESSYALEGSSLKGYRDYAGDGIFRFSIGLEDAEDIIRDLGQILEK